MCPVPGREHSTVDLAGSDNWVLCEALCIYRCSPSICLMQGSTYPQHPSSPEIMHNTGNGTSLVSPQKVIQLFGATYSDSFISSFKTMVFFSGRQRTIWELALGGYPGENISTELFGMSTRPTSMINGQLSAVSGKMVPLLVQLLIIPRLGFRLSTRVLEPRSYISTLWF